MLDIQTSNVIVVSDTQAKVYIKELGAYLWYIWRQFHRQGYRWEDHAASMVVLIRDRQEKHTDFPKAKRVIECSIENFVSVVAVTKQKAAPSIGSSSAKGNSEREKDVEERRRCISHPMQVIEEQPLEDKPPSVATDAAGDNLAKETKSKERNHRFRSNRKSQCVHEPGGEARGRDFIFYKIWRLDHSRSQNSERGKLAHTCSDRAR